MSCPLGPFEETDPSNLKDGQATHENHAAENGSDLSTTPDGVQHQSTTRSSSFPLTGNPPRASGSRRSTQAQLWSSQSAVSLSVQTCPPCSALFGCLLSASFFFLRFSVYPGLAWYPLLGHVRYRLIHKACPPDDLYVFVCAVFIN